MNFNSWNICREFLQSQTGSTWQNGISDFKKLDKIDLLRAQSKIYDEAFLQK